MPAPEESGSGWMPGASATGSSSGGAAGVSICGAEGGVGGSSGWLLAGTWTVCLQPGQRTSVPARRSGTLRPSLQCGQLNRTDGMNPFGPAWGPGQDEWSEESPLCITTYTPRVTTSKQRQMAERTRQPMVIALKTAAATRSPVPEAISEPDNVTTSETSDRQSVNNSPSRIRRMESTSPSLPRYANFAVWTRGVNAGRNIRLTPERRDLLQHLSPSSRSTAAGKVIVDVSIFTVTIVTGARSAYGGRDEDRFSTSTSP